MKHTTYIVSNTFHGSNACTKTNDQYADNEDSCNN
jgi:hypothetical protein